MEQKQNWLERPIHPALPGVTNEIVIFFAIILLAFVTRFYMLGTRVMSHDESLHTPIIHGAYIRGRDTNIRP